MQNFLHAIALLYPISAILAVSLQGPWTISTIFISAFIYPTFEFLEARYFPRLKQIGERRFTWIASAVSYACAALVIFLIILLVLKASALSRADIWIVLCYSVGLCSGTIGITLAHEFMHRRKRLDRALSTMLLIFCGYSWFAFQHLRRHHVRVATSDDFASAELNQSVYSFYRKSIFLGIFDTCAFLKNSLVTQKSSQKTQGIAKRILFDFFIFLGINLGLFFGLGWIAWASYIAQGIVAVLVLETINYIQHYGLKRSSVLEKIKESNSWDCVSLTNYSIFNLGLHADHHCHPGKKFSQLASSVAAPRMPFGYFLMALLALLPRIWRPLMNRQILRERNRLKF